MQQILGIKEGHEYPGQLIYVLGGHDIGQSHHDWQLSSVGGWHGHVVHHLLVSTFEEKKQSNSFKFKF